MPAARGRFTRDPISVELDGWARQLLDVLRADPWNWHGRMVETPAASVRLGEDRAGLSRHERAAVRSLHWNLSHAASSGLRIRPEWSLQTAWAPEAFIEPYTGERRRLLTARVTPKDAGRRSVLVRGRSSYIANPTSRGAHDGENWQPRG